MNKKVKLTPIVTRMLTKEDAKTIADGLAKGLPVIVHQDVLKPESRFGLYKRLKDSGYPQGGGGQYMQDPDTNEKVYIPTHQELITHYISSPKGWEILTDTLATRWIDNKNGDTQTKESS